MSFSQKLSSPPEYGQLPPSAATNQIFLDRIQTAVNAEYNDANNDPTETNRLRNFLLYCLAMDYRVPCELVLSTTDRAHYLELCATVSVIRTIGPTVRDIHLEAENRRKIAPYFWKYLHAPCIGLGIPVESAVQVVLRYGKFITMTGRFKGCVHGVLHSFGVEYLAGKFVTDRSVLIPRLVGNRQIRVQLTESLTEVARSYFTSIDGNSSTILVGNDPNVRFEEEWRTHWTLTPRGQNYASERNKTLHAVKKRVEPVLFKVLYHLIGPKRLHGDIFPRSLREGLCDDTCIGPVPLSGPKESPTWSEPPFDRDVGSIDVPDLFEHRPGQGRCDS